MRLLDDALIILFPFTIVSLIGSFVLNVTDDALYVAAFVSILAVRLFSKVNEGLERLDEIEKLVVTSMSIPNPLQQKEKK